MNKNLKTQWRVQKRKSRAHKWANKGLFETRSAARLSASMHRDFHEFINGRFVPPAGFGNTRVIKYVKGAK